MHRPQTGQTADFVLLDEWVSKFERAQPRGIAGRTGGALLWSHGPATLQDFAGWAGLTVSEARVGLESIKQELISRTIDGKEYWMTGASPNRGAHDPVGAYLLPAFDEYLIGYKDRSAVLTGDGMQGIIPYSNGMFLPVILYEGLVTGTWQRTIKKQAVEVALLPLFPRTILKKAPQRRSSGLAALSTCPIPSIKNIIKTGFISTQETAYSSPPLIFYVIF